MTIRDRFRESILASASMFRVIVVKAQMYENYSVAQYLPLHFFISARAALRKISLRAALGFQTATGRTLKKEDDQRPPSN